MPDRAAGQKVGTAVGTGRIPREQGAASRGAAARVGCQRGNMQSVIESVADLVGNFLMKIGGRSNGYMTYASGEIRDQIATLRLMVPPPAGGDSANTYVQLQQWKDQLKREIRKLLPKNFFDVYKSLRIEDEYMGDGCYKTWVCPIGHESAATLSDRKPELPGFDNG